MSDPYWVRLNDLPAPTLPQSEGDEARQRFDDISGRLKVMQRERGPSISSPNECIPDVVTLRAGEGISPRTQLGLLHFWNRPCCRAHENDSPHWGFADMEIEFSYCRAVGYPFNCNPATDPQENSVWYREELLPSQMKGVLRIDWDRDGDDDLAVWLMNGQYIFFRQEQCPAPHDPETLICRNTLTTE